MLDISEYFTYRHAIWKGNVVGGYYFVAAMVVANVN